MPAHSEGVHWLLFPDTDTLIVHCLMMHFEFMSKALVCHLMSSETLAVSVDIR